MSGLDERKPLPAHIKDIAGSLEVFIDVLITELVYLVELNVYAKYLDDINYSDPRYAPHKKLLKNAAEDLHKYNDNTLKMLTQLMSDEDRDDFVAAMQSIIGKYYENRITEKAKKNLALWRSEELILCKQLLLRGSLYSEDEHKRNQAWQTVTDFYSADSEKSKYTVLMKAQLLYGHNATRLGLDSPETGNKDETSSLYKPLILLFQRATRLHLLGEAIDSVEKRDPPTFEKYKLNVIPVQTVWIDTGRILAMYGDDLYRDRDNEGVLSGLEKSFPAAEPVLLSKVAEWSKSGVKVKVLKTDEEGIIKQAEVLIENLDKLYADTRSLVKDLIKLHHYDFELTGDLLSRYTALKARIPPINASALATGIASALLNTETTDEEYMRCVTQVRVMLDNIYKLTALFYGAPEGVTVAPMEAKTETAEKLAARAVKEYLQGFVYPHTLMSYIAAKELLDYCKTQKIGLTSAEKKLIYMSIAVNHPNIAEKVETKDNPLKGAFKNLEEQFLYWSPLSAIHLRCVHLKSFGMSIPADLRAELQSLLAELRKIPSRADDPETKKPAVMAVPGASVTTQPDTFDDKSWADVKDTVKRIVAETNANVMLAVPARTIPLKPALSAGIGTARLEVQEQPEHPDVITVVDKSDDSQISYKHLAAEQSMQLQFSKNFFGDGKSAITDYKEDLLRASMDAFDAMPKGTVITIGNCKDTPEQAKVLYALAQKRGLKVEYDKNDGTLAAVRKLDKEQRAFAKNTKKVSPAGESAKRRRFPGIGRLRGV